MANQSNPCNTCAWEDNKGTCHHRDVCRLWTAWKKTGKAMRREEKKESIRAQVRSNKFGYQPGTAADPRD